MKTKISLAFFQAYYGRPILKVALKTPLRALSREFGVAATRGGDKDECLVSYPHSQREVLVRLPQDVLPLLR